ncbi:Rib/alpha-like domain-containing protein, partial [Streptococcus acidominimus]
MKSRQKMDWYRLGQRFSIRTYHVGAVSVLLGSLLLGSPVVQAEENISLDSQPLETVVEEVAKAEETVLVPASTEASVTPAEAPSTDTAVADDLEKASLETQEPAKATAVDTAVTEEKLVATPEAIAVEASSQEDKPALTVKEPTKVPVGNVNALTENEKAEVRANVLAVNETATDVVVADNGQVTLYFGEKTATLASSQVVKQKPVASRRVLRSASTELEPKKSYVTTTIGKAEFEKYLNVTRKNRKTNEETIISTNNLDEVVLIPDNTGWIEAKIDFKDKVSLNHDFTFDADIYIGSHFDGKTRGDLIAFSLFDELNDSPNTDSDNFMYFLQNGHFKNAFFFNVESWYHFIDQLYIGDASRYPVGKLYKSVDNQYINVSSARNNPSMPETDSSWKELDKNLMTDKFANLRVNYTATDKNIHIRVADKEWRYSIADIIDSSPNPEKEFTIRMLARTGAAVNEHKFRFKSSTFAVGIHIPVIPTVSVQNAAGTQNNDIIVRGEPNAIIKLYQNGQEIGQALSDENGVAHIIPTVPLTETPLTARSEKEVNGANVLSDPSNEVTPFRLKDPVKVLVDNPQQLTPAEKAQVEDEIRVANPTVPIQSVAVTDTGEATLTYADGTTSSVVNYTPDKTIKQKDSEKYTPIVGKVTKPETDPVTAQDVTDQVTAPAGTEFTNKEVKGDIPTTVGTHDVPVEVTYPDGTKEVVNVPVEITDVADKDQFDPIVGKVTKPETDPVTAQDVTGQVTAPNGTQLTDKQVKGDLPTTVGTHDVPVEVTYPDGTKEIVNVPVEITKGADNATNEPQLKPDAPNTPAVSAGKALIDGSDVPESPLSPADQEVVKDKVDTSNLPEGTTVTPADKVTGTPENPVVEVTVTYPDGTTDTIEVPVKQKDSATNEPSVEADEPNTPAISAGKALIDGSDRPESPLSDADKAVVADKVDTSNLPEGTVVTPADKVTGTPDNPVVEVTVTYPDGTTDTINVPVKQKDSATNEPSVKADEPNTPAISTGKALIDGSDVP